MIKLTVLLILVSLQLAFVRMFSLLLSLNALPLAMSMLNVQDMVYPTNCLRTAKYLFVTKLLAPVLLKMTPKRIAKNVNWIANPTPTVTLLNVYGLALVINANILQRTVTMEKLALLIPVIQQLDNVFTLT
jgi:hypothetical protein